ncbi:chemotaxis protein CheW [Dyella choica]|uniref:Chemotaxis protein CheW n=1 Tax=Dyella choica TaxID=1927959 RepID=A0A3S0SB29_9GAMM|nr:chemotaxis protein CheW [Dyella choica]RUL77561.1 chemotaxis protein CheW [Dyella choica]
MLFLLFRIGQDRYVLETARIAEVIPLVRMKQVPHGPFGIAGLIDYRGWPVPVFDVSQLALRQPAAIRLSTRIVLVRYAPMGDDRLLGLLVEHATKTLQRDPADFVSAGIRQDGASYLGPVCSDDDGLIQWVEPNRLLSEEARSRLFTQGAPAP